MTSWVKEIGAITLFVEDMEKTKVFYQTVFELPVLFEDDASTVFKFGNTLINLLQNAHVTELIAPAQAAKGHRLVFSIGVDDVDAMCAQLIKRGIKLLNGPMDRPWGLRTASFVDPNGYIWEISK